MCLDLTESNLFHVFVKLYKIVMEADLSWKLPVVALMLSIGLLLRTCSLFRQLFVVLVLVDTRSVVLVCHWQLTCIAAWSDDLAWTMNGKIMEDGEKQGLYIIYYIYIIYIIYFQGDIHANVFPGPSSVHAGMAICSPWWPVHHARPGQLVKPSKNPTKAEIKQLVIGTLHAQYSFMNQFQITTGCDWDVTVACS